MESKATPVEARAICSPQPYTALQGVIKIHIGAPIVVDFGEKNPKWEVREPIAS